MIGDRSKWRVVAVVVASGAGACGPRSIPAPTYGALDGEVARVGDARVGAALIAEVARARSVAPPIAMGALVEDALVAEGAAALGFDRSPGVAWATTAALGRLVPRRVLEEARSQGLPTDDELARVTVVHAVVLRSHRLPEARALFTARTIADAVATASTSDQFLARARGVSSEFRTSIEALPAFDAAGHTVDGQALDLDFTAAAFALQKVGETSPIVETPFGWHVIRLVSRRPPSSDEREPRRTELGDAVIALRARSQLAKVLRERKERTHVEVSGAASELMGEVSLAP